MVREDTDVAAVSMQAFAGGNVAVGYTNGDLILYRYPCCSSAGDKKVVVCRQVIDPHA